MNDRSCHRLSVRVYYEDTDAGGVVYHTAYLRFAERGRTEFLRACGFDHRSLYRTEGGGFVVRSMTAEFLAAARLDDRLAVETRLEAVTGARLRMNQVVMRDDAELVRLGVHLAFVSGGRAIRLPRAVRGMFPAAAGPALHGEPAE